MKVRQMLNFYQAMELIRVIRNVLYHYQRLRLSTNVRQKLNIIWAVVSINIIPKMALVITTHLKRVNKTVDGSLSDTHEQVKIYKLTKEIPLHGSVRFEYFDEVYRIFVERKRRKLLEDADAIDNRYREYRMRCEQEGLPYKALQAEEDVKRHVLETYYAYLQDDDGYRQKAFLEFLKKKIEDGDDRKEIRYYMETKHMDESFDEYVSLPDIPWYIEPVNLWVEFFSSGTGYTCMISNERPRVVYRRTDEKIPRFIFERPYVEKFTEQEFRDRFTIEWEVTNDNPEYDECDDRLYYRECEYELKEDLNNAYVQYLNAVIRFNNMLKNYGTHIIDMPIQ